LGKEKLKFTSMAKTCAGTGHGNTQGVAKKPTHNFKNCVKKIGNRNLMSTIHRPAILLRPRKPPSTARMNRETTESEHARDQGVLGRRRALAAETERSCVGHRPGYML
jgi:hypothetical protein